MPITILYIGIVIVAASYITYLHYRIALMGKGAKKTVRKDGSGFDAFHNSPIPMWTKEVLRDGEGKVSFVMRELNLAYEMTFMPIGMGGRNSYYGKTDFEYWGEEIGEIYHKHDLRSYVGGQVYDFVEKAKLANGGTADFPIYKWTSRDKEGREYVHGLAILKQNTEQ